MTDAGLLELVLAEVRALRRVVDALAARRLPDHAGLVAAIGEEFPPGSRFTVSGLLTLAAEDPGGALATALGHAIDLDALPRSRATALGRLLARLPGVEIIGEARGVAVYRLLE
jgi:hypothetical protein